MTNEEIIQGLQFTIDMFLSDPLTGEPITKPRNDMDKTTIDACKGAIELLTQEPCEDAISREQAVDAVADLFEMSEYPHPYPQGKPIRLKDIKEKLKQLPSVQPKPIECEDAISRQAAIKATWQDTGYTDPFNVMMAIRDRIKQLPPAQPEIIRCRECKFASGDSRICMKFDHSPIGELDFCAWAERRTDEQTKD